VAHTAHTRSFGEWLAARRKSQGLTREELARRVGCAPITVEKLERGERKPSAPLARLLFAALDVPTDEHNALIRLARSEERTAEEGGGGGKRATGTGTAPLPSPLTAILGRERELEEAATVLVGPEVRLLTLMGPGGVGKTRLALHVAGDVARNFPDGAHFVPLAPITDPDLVAPTIARAVGLKGTEAPDLEGLKRALRGSRMLLLLDNFEQVIAAAPRVADLLAWCPHVKALVTSREALDLRGERRMIVPPLQVPRPGDIEAGQDWRGYSAVRLFTERAESVSDFRLGEDNVREVARLCARLDGLPLAIELAAARATLLSPGEMLARLDRRLPLTGGGTRDLPDRHRTLHAAITWSYELLSAEEQRLFRRLAVFRGGFTLDGAEAVCNAHADLPAGTLEGIASLLAKSLLVDGDHGSAHRFMMLETIREYAWERLDESGECDAVQSLHAQYYLALSHMAEPELTGPRQAEWLALLEGEHDNLRSALQWCLRSPDGATMGLRIAGALLWFWQVRGHLSEGRERLGAALRRPEVGRTEERSKALFAAGTLALFQGDYEAARLHFSESMEIEAERGNLWGMTLAINGLGRVAEYQGDFDGARRLYEEALEIRTRIGHRWGVAGSLNNLGRAAMRQGNLDRAHPLLVESLSIFRETDDRSSTAMVLSNLALAALREHDHEQALGLFSESLRLSMEISYKWGVPFCLIGYAEVACARGDGVRAARLLGAAERILSAIGARMDPIDRAQFERVTAEAKGLLSRERFTEAWREGASLSIEEAARYAGDGLLRDAAAGV
jgi:predicted ATPase/transcriptional regulator with XRE-family HTH domain